MIDEVISLRCKPARNVPSGRKHDLQAQNSVRVLRSSPETVTLQIRREKDYVTAALSFEEAARVEDALRQAVPDSHNALITIIHGLLAICPWRDKDGKEHEAVAMARRVAPIPEEDRVERAAS